MIEMVVHKRERKLTKKLRKVINKVHPDEMKLSPATVYEILEEDEERDDVQVVELTLDETGETTKHISFMGVPIILAIKPSHHQKRLAFV
jgi:hypothetical protein